MKLVSRLNVIADSAPKALGEALDETAIFILNWIRIFAPVKTGQLRDSYEIQKENLLHVLIGSGLIYSKYQEWGTSRQAGTPHVAPSFALGENFLRQKVYEKMTAI